MANRNKVIRNGRRIRARLAHSRLEAKRHWFSKLMDYTNVNAFYFLQQNYAIIGPGMARRPFFDAKFPAYVNYAALGELIGHEITHGFDTKGRKYDATGRYE